MSCDGKKKGECLKSGLCEWELRTLVGQSKRKGFCIHKKSSSRLSPKKETNTFKAKKNWNRVLSKLRKSNKAKKNWNKALSKIRKSNKVKKNWNKAMSKIRKSYKAKKNWNKAMSNVRRRKPITIYYNQLNNFPVFQNMSSNTSEGNNGNSFGESPFIYPLVKDWSAKTDDFVLLNTILDTSTSKLSLKTLYKSIRNVTKRKLVTLINICLRLGVELESGLWIYLTHEYFNRIKDIKLKESETLPDIMKVELYNDDLADYIYENFSDEYKIVKYLENSKDSNIELTPKIIESIYTGSSLSPFQSSSLIKDNKLFIWLLFFSKKKGKSGYPNGNVIIPSLVTSIGYGAFFGCNMITGITLPDSVSSIGINAFKGCFSLTNITIPDSVKTIKYGAFNKCNSLRSIVLSKSITTINDETFANCSSLTTITIPDSVTSIERSAFGGCSSLTSITIPGSVTNIKPTAFGKCISLISITIPDSVTYIGNDAFYGCRNLERITIPNSVKTLGFSLLGFCSALTKLVIPDSITLIPEELCILCIRLNSVTIPSSVTIIEKKAFYGCKSLTNITIPNSVVHIKEGAFQGCTSLKTITIPDSVKIIEKNAFKGCKQLKEQLSQKYGMKTMNLWFGR